jgi:hypothetical protein
VADLEADALAQTEAFAIDYPEGIWVSLTAGRKFDVIVHDLQGAVLEEHRSITQKQLMRARSDYFTVRPTTPGS